MTKAFLALSFAFFSASPLYAAGIYCLEPTADFNRVGYQVAVRPGQMSFVDLNFGSGRQGLNLPARMSSEATVNGGHRLTFLGNQFLLVVSNKKVSEGNQEWGLRHYARIYFGSAANEFQSESVTLYCDVLR